MGDLTVYELLASPKDNLMGGGERERFYGDHKDLETWIEDTSFSSSITEVNQELLSNIVSTDGLVDQFENSSDLTSKLTSCTMLCGETDLGTRVVEVPQNIEATGKNPVKDNYSGSYKFDIKFDQERGGASWNYSKSIDKLYIKMDNKIQIPFMYEAHGRDDLYVRALPVFLDSNNFTNPVQRCYSHKNPDDIFNKGYRNATDHIIRIHDQHVVYYKNEDSGRFSVVVYLGPKQNGTKRVYKPLSFMCQNSCLGMKRPLAVIFTLEDRNCHVLGRRTLNVKVCSGPNRDRKIEEKSFPLVKDTKTRKRKATATDSAENGNNATATVNVPNSILKLVVSYAGLRLRELCEEENRKPDENEKQCLKQYNEILETLRQDKRLKMS